MAHRRFDSVCTSTLAQTRLKRCYIHVGTHKTGSTSLQDCLTRNAGVFADADIYIASTGRPVSLAKSYYIANQNLAWQMLADRRFEPSFGTLADLERELARSPLQHAVVTSEDFVLAYDRPERLEDLRDACTRAGYRPTIVIYLREQVSYAKSLYAMFVVNGKLPVSFHEFCDFIFGDGVMWGPYRFPFEYDAILDPFVRCFGAENVIVRPYPETRGSTYLIDDFISIVDSARSIDIDRLAIGSRLNEAESYLRVMESLHGNLIATRPDLDAPLSIANRCKIPLPLLELPYDGIDEPTAARFRKRFRRHNESLEARFAIAFDWYGPRDSLDRQLQLDFLRACTEAWK